MSQPKLIFYAKHRTDYTEACRSELQAVLDLPVLDSDADLGEQFRGVEMVIEIGGHAPREIIDAGEDVKLWQVIGTGLDNCEVAYTLGKGIAIANTPGFTSAKALAESVMMYILMLTRQYHTSRDNFFAGDFFLKVGATLDGMVLGIIGFGASGSELARRAKAFGMRIEAIDIRPLAPDVPDSIRPDFYGGPEDMHAMISRCDVVSLHLHLTSETKHIINRDRLKRMQRTAYLINVARGALVDEDALAAALLEGEIGGAGIDVFCREPADVTRPEYQLPNLIVTPHTSGQTDDTIRRRCAIAIENARRLAAEEALLHTIDASQGLGRF